MHARKFKVIFWLGMKNTIKFVPKITMLPILTLTPVLPININIKIDLINTIMYFVVPIYHYTLYTAHAAPLGLYVFRKTA